MPPRLRRAGSRWRILVHERDGERRAHDITSDPRSPARHAQTLASLARLGDGTPPPDLTVVTVLPDTEFDEVVVGRFLHLEQMDTGLYWLNVGGVTINIRADRDGRPRSVDVYGPNDYDGPVEGCRYSLSWGDG